MNIKKSLRIIFRNKIYGTLNIAGLAIGITSAALIFLWVESKVNFNRAIPHSENLYMAGAHKTQNSGEIISDFGASNPLALSLREDFPEIKRTSRYVPEKRILTPENTTHSFEEEGVYADADLFGMIGMRFLSGSPETAFDPVHSIVISQSMAQKIYGAEDPLGKGLIYEGTMYEITGVFKDLPRNTSFRFEWAMPFRLLYDEMKNKFIVDEWGFYWMYLYVEPEAHVDIAQLNEKLKVLPEQKAGSGYRLTQNFLYPLNRVLLYGNFKDGVESGDGYVKTVRLFFFIGVLILLIACINFMNLSTARSQKRALEVGVRKTFGTKRKYLIRQFLAESGLITLIALLLSVFLVWLFLPLFNSVMATDLVLDFTNSYVWAGCLGIALFCTFTAGSYPALFLSSFNPVTTLKMQQTGKKGMVVRVRQGLVIFQFTMAFVLLCSTCVIYLQIHQLLNREIGIEKENLVTFPVTQELRDAYASVLNELKNTGLTEGAGFASTTLLQRDTEANPWYWNGKEENDDASVHYFFITEGVLDAAGIDILEGSDVTPTHGGVLINETLAKRMGEEGRVGGRIGQSNDQKWEITGIVKDFRFGDLYAVEHQSAIFVRQPRRANFLFVRLRPETDRYEAIGRIQSLLKHFTPYHNFEPVWMTDIYNRKFEEDRLIEKLSALFAALAILISCLGLLGLSAFSAEQRTKEIGVRKVLGAKVGDILFLLGKSYLALLSLSFLIGIPISLYIANRYLASYAYRIVPGWHIFAAVALAVALIALLTVSALSLRAAVANPARSMKN